MLCKELMKTKLECISPRESVEAAARRMREANVGFLPVCDEAGRVLGTLTDRDIAIRLVAEGLPASAPVQEVMSLEVVSCRPDDELRQAEELMGEYHKSRILVLDGDESLVGVISLSDVAQRDEQRAARTMKAVTVREARA